MFENRKARQIPPCSKCGKDQLAYEFFFKLDVSKSPSDMPPQKTLFFCSDCYDDMFKDCTHYRGEVKQEWSPV